MDSDLAVMMLSIYSCSVCTEDLPSMTCPQLLTNSWGLWPHTPRGQSQILGMLSGRADRVWLHSKECWCSLISALWVPWGTFSSPTSGSPLPCCPGRAVPWLASTACYWAGFACPNHIPIVLRPLSSSNSCPCEHVTNPSCPPLRPLEWGRRNLTTGRNRRRTRGCRSTEVRWFVPDVIHTELTGT